MDDRNTLQRALFDPALDRAGRGALVRARLRGLWDAAPAPGTGVALALVGSFAMDEGGACSDVDVVILHEPMVSAGAVDAIVRAVLYPLWDDGVSVDHSVRTPAQCRAVAKEDLRALTGLLDLMFVAGDRALVDAVSARVAADLRRAAPTRIGELVADARARWEAEGPLAHLNEPDLKASHGGLRDLSLLRALAASWLADYPHGRVDAAARVVLDVRDALHVEVRRHTTKLLRVHQGAVAERLGYADDVALMRALAEAGAMLADAADAACERALRARASWGRGGLRRRVVRAVSPRRAPGPDLREIAPGIALDGDQTVFAGRSGNGSRGRVARDARSPARDPESVLALAAASAQLGVVPSQATLEDIAAAVSEGRHDGTAPGFWAPPRMRLFLDLLGASAGLADVWFALDRTGLPAAWIPEWEAVRFRPQRAEFHRWTVDWHCIGTVARAGGAEVRAGGAVNASAAERDALLLAALLHDIGKRPGAPGVDHPHTGAALVPGILKRMGRPDLVPAVAPLVEHHLLLAQAATTMDPAAPETIRAVMDPLGGDLRLLESLAILTRADSEAAGPKAWSPWRASLVGAVVDACRAVSLGADSPR